MNPYWSYLLTAVGAVGLLLAGRMKRTGWLVGLGAQGLWIAYALSTGQLGFLVSAFLYGSVYARNYLAWRRTARQRTEVKTREQRMGDLAAELLEVASPDISLLDRDRYVAVLIRFARTAVAWEKQQKGKA